MMEAVSSGRGPRTPPGLMGRDNHPGEPVAVADGGGALALALALAYLGSGVAGDTWTVGSGSSSESMGANGETVRGVGSSAGTGGAGPSERGATPRRDGLFVRFCDEEACPNVVRRLLRLGTWPMAKAPDAPEPGPGEASRTVGSSSRERGRIDASEYRLNARKGDFMKESVGDR